MDRRRAGPPPAPVWTLPASPLPAVGATPSALPASDERRAAKAGRAQRARGRRDQGCRDQGCRAAIAPQPLGWPEIRRRQATHERRRRDLVNQPRDPRRRPSAHRAGGAPNRRWAADEQSGRPARKCARARHRSAHKSGPQRLLPRADAKSATVSQSDNATASLMALSSLAGASGRTWMQNVPWGGRFLYPHPRPGTTWSANVPWGRLSRNLERGARLITK